MKEREEETLLSITKVFFVEAYGKIVSLKITFLDIYVLPMEDRHSYSL